MFNKNSIFFTLSISLIVSIILLIISFFTITEINHATNINTLKKKYSTIERIVNQEYARFGFTNDLKYIIDDMDLLLIDKGKDIHKILKQKNLRLIAKKRTENILLHIFQANNDNFLHFQTPFEEFLIIDSKVTLSKYNPIIVSVFLMLLIMILLIAYSVYKKLSPLYELKEKISDIGNKDMQLEFLKENSKDEVSLLAKALIDKSENLNNIKIARDVFIRNIMHELKTPITKGRFLTELKNTEENQEKFKKVFHQLESLISEFALIEEIIAKKNIDKKDIFFDDILENVLDLLMLEDEKAIEVEINTLKININFKLFSIAIKNIIDNALKYSADKKVRIKFEKDTIAFINKGEPLTYDLINYYEPFFNNENRLNQKESFGLGFYIIKSILDAHKFKLDYSYNNLKKENIFTIIL